MEKIDRLGWAEGIAIDTFGLRIGVRVSRGEVMAKLQKRFPPGWKRARSPVVDHLYSLRVPGGSQRAGVRLFHLLYSDHLRLARSLDLEEVLGAFESDLQSFVALTAPSHLFVHAGVVGFRDRAILFPGRSLHGKTTLVSAMVKAGAVYYSDEYAVLDSRGRVHPFARPLGVRSSPESRGRKVPVQTLGGRRGQKPLPVGLVVESRYQEGAGWRPRRLSPAEGVMSLLAHTVAARLRPRFAIATLTRALQGVAAIKSSRGEADDVVASILSAL